MPDLDTRLAGKYISLTSFKRDGIGVATPVWFVIDDGHLLVQTDGNSFKVRRIRRNPQVTVAPCNASGRPRGPAVPATAEVRTGSELEQTRSLMARKYRLDRIFILPIYWAVQRLRGHRSSGSEVALVITPT